MTRAMLNAVRFDKSSPLTRAAEAVRMRKDIWPSRAAAREWLAKRFPYRRWDARVLDLFVVRLYFYAPRALGTHTPPIARARNTRCESCQRPCTRTRATRLRSR